MNHEPNMFIVSNRLPVTVERHPSGSQVLVKSPGGLVSGLSDVHQRVDALWIGHCGLFVDNPDFTATSRHLMEHRYAAVPIESGDYHAYYNGLSNGCLWPICHYFLGRARFETSEWQAYIKINRQFADAVLALARPGDRVWVHDYHLMLLPSMLRQAEPTLEIAYFHHIPFPATEMFRFLPWRSPLLAGLLGADLIGMHTLEYIMHFQASVTRLLGVEVAKDQIHYQGRIIRLGAFPLGVDVESIRACMQGIDPQGHLADLARAAAGKTVFLGIDRLDYTKGIPERLNAFRVFLQEHPDLIGEVMFVQICVPSRAEVQSYVELRATIEQLVGQINGEFSRPGYVPLHYLYQPFEAADVRQFYKLGDIAVVTPLCDGLNLVCKEYVASRDDEEGVLILSEFAGAAAEMGEAILVNPFDIAGLATAMARAYTMPSEERRRRMRLLRQRVALGDNIEWAKRFLRTWIDEPLWAGRRSRPLTAEARNDLLNRFSSGKIFLCLDYDGTLVPIRATPEEALPDPELLRLLHWLGSLPNVEVALITGRAREFCDRYFGNLPVSIAAEHSGFFRRRGERLWSALADSHELERLKPQVLPHFESYVNRFPGALIEEKATAIVLHYRKADSVFAHRQANDLRESLSRILADTGYSAFQAKRAIEVKPVTANKGHAVEHFLAAWGHQGQDFITAGDDRTDEDMFLVEVEHNHSIYVGHAHAFARYHVDKPSELADFLAALADKLSGGAHASEADRDPSFQNRGPFFHRLPGSSASSPPMGGSSDQTGRSRGAAREVDRPGH